jgi:leucyl aminopeptidase
MLFEPNYCIKKKRILGEKKMLCIKPISKAETNMQTELMFGEKPGKGKTILNAKNNKIELKIGLPPEKELTLNDFFKSGSKTLATAKELEKDTLQATLPRTKKFCFEETVKAFTEGLLFRSYEFTKYKTKKEQKNPSKVFVICKQNEQKKLNKIINETEKIQKNVSYLRDMVNDNSNVVTPAFFVKEAKKLPGKIKVTTINEKKMKKLGMNLILSVGRAGTTPPELILLEYNGAPNSKEKILLVGKGITFDSGGLNIKTEDYMTDMRTDMAGAATVLAIIKTASELNLKKNIIGALACAENLVDSKSFRPGDIIKSHCGKTVEIGNTDAEGRLVLAEALSYSIKKYNPAIVIDYATLTGACAYTFGNIIAGMISNNDTLSEKMHTAGMKTFERVWRLPLYEEYKEDMKSTRADIRATSKSGKAGTIAAAAFLNEFVNNVPWIHLDIAGTAFYTKPPTGHTEGATGFGLRLTLEFLK